MKKELKNNFKDKRGEIIDIFINYILLLTPTLLLIVINVIYSYTHKHLLFLFSKLEPVLLSVYF